MANMVIWVENLGKNYVIGHQKQERYTALRDGFIRKMLSVWAMNKDAKLYE